MRRALIAATVAALVAILCTLGYLGAARDQAACERDHPETKAACR